MANLIKFALGALLFCYCPVMMAQQKPAIIKPIQKFKPPKLTTTLGIRTDTATVFREEAVQLVTLPLKITDSKKSVYIITSYSLNYKRVALSEDEQTGKTFPVTNNVSDNFTSTPLPQLWKKIIAEEIKPGEELFFYDIVVKDSQGRLMYAPTLRIKIK